MPARRWGDDFHLQDLLAQRPGGPEFAARDFALLTLAARLASSFPGQLVFKGGFVLRHVHGLLRFSKDVDATRHDPPKHKLDAADFAAAIRQASIGDQVRFDPGTPVRDTARSLDFDAVRVTGALMEASTVQVEVSYREAVVDPPQQAVIASPFYEDFSVLVLQPHEMTAEKLRTLAQRTRPTDLADLAVMLQRLEIADADVARVARTKFEVVKQGVSNRAARVENNLAAIGAEYDDVVPAVFPAAPSYSEAMQIAWPRVKDLIPA